MDLSGEYRIPAPPGRVWQALNDVDILRVSVPGCQEMEKTDENAFRAKVQTKIGAIKATFTGRVTLSDIDPPNGYTISGQGEGGPAGFAKGSARVRLKADGADTTILTYVAKADVGGKLASVGNRLVQGVAAKTAEEFFSRFCAAVTEGGVMTNPPHPESMPGRPEERQDQARGPEHRGPAEPTVGVARQVPSEPTVPYTIGMTPGRQNRVIVIAGVIWLLIVGLITLSG